MEQTAPFSKSSKFSVGNMFVQLEVATIYDIVWAGDEIPTEGHSWRVHILHQPIAHRSEL